MQFAHPESLYLLALCLFAVGVTSLLHRRWRQKTLAQFGDHPMLLKMADAHSTRRARLRTVFYLLATVFIGIAAAQPQWGLTNKPIKRTGVDIVFALDISKSMLARDAAPNRLDAAKTEIKELMGALAGDRVGLVVFTAVSFPQSPLTIDYGAIRFYLDKLDPGQMPLGGTSIGRAIMDSIGLLTGGDESSQARMKRAKNQIVVLISDGEDHESAPLEAADAAAAQGIKIVTVGFGSSTGERIPLYKQDGTLLGYQRDRSGEIVRTRLDVETLKGIADKTGGVYIHYSGRNSVAQGVADFIGALEKSELESLMKERYQDRFMLFLVPGFVFLLLGLLLGERRFARTTLVAASLVALSGCDALLRDTDSDVDRGIEQIAAGQYDDALVAFEEAETRLGSQAELAFNRGIAQLGNKQMDEAQASFARALESPDPLLRLKAMTNLGVTLGQKDQWKEAYKQFQEALIAAAEVPVLDANIHEKLKKNLEFAWRKVFPPCHELDDSLEENDTRELASKPEKIDQFEGVTCPTDDDWFVLPVIAGTRVSVDVDFKDLREDPDPDQAFLDVPENLHISLVAPGGDQVLAVHQGDVAGLDGERAQRRATRSIKDFVVTDEMLAGADHVLLRIAGTREAKYTAKVVAIPPCHAMQEATEPNNTPESAASVQGEPVQGHVCPGDEDWYAVDLQPGDTVFVDVQPGNDTERGTAPSLELELVAQDQGIRLAEGAVEGAFITAGVREYATGGRVLIHVKPEDADQQGPYSLTVYTFAPCIAGNDRFEVNDSPDTATKLDGSQPQVRYLRLCEADLDYFTVPIDPKKKRLNVGLSLVSTPVDADAPENRAAMQLDRMSPSGDQILQAGISPDSPDVHDVPLVSVLTADDVEGETALLRVSGDSEFYHLSMLDGQQGGGESAESEQKQELDSPQEPQDSGDSGDPEQKPGDEQNPAGDENEAPEGEQDEKAGDQGEEQGQSQDDPAASEERKTEEEGQEGQALSPTAEKDAEMQRIDEILKALESTDDNFQMRKALKELPNRYIDKDW